MLLIRKLKLHIGSIVVAFALVVGAVVWQWLYSQSSGRMASGSSLPGLVVGSFAAAIILFELLLWPRKKLRRWKLFPTKYWMVAHLWLGLATGPLAFIHSGYRFGSTFGSILMTLLLLVLASGIYGWIMQVCIPKWMLGNLPYETIASQIGDVSIQAALNARRMLTVAYGPKPDRLTKLANLDKITAKMRGAVTLHGDDGATKAIIVGSVQRRDSNRSTIQIDAENESNADDGMVLWKQYAAVIEPFVLNKISLSDGRMMAGNVGRESPLSTRQKAESWFSILRESCSRAANPIVDHLEELCLQRLQYDTQRRAHAWLHGWIAFHAGISVLLGVLLVAHVILALKYM